MGKKCIPWVAGAIAATMLVMSSGCTNNSETEEKLQEGITENSTLDAAEEAVQETSESTENVVTDVSTDGYVYQTLPQNMRNVYDEVYDAIVNYKEDIPVSTLDKEVLDQTYRSVMSDHGGLFWVSGYTYTQYTKGGALVDLHFTPKYTMAEEERDDLQVQIDEACSQILSGIGTDAGDYDKAKYVFDYLASNVAYETGAVNNQNIISVFINQATVCQGYASATQYLLDQLGIVSAVVTGTANGESHAWNIAKLDGEYYYIDTTWGNTSYSGGKDLSASFINYNYFAVTTEELQVTHVPNQDIILPVCTATRDNYYVHENLYFTEWKPEEVGNVFAEAYKNGTEFCSVKFASQELYQQAFSYFISDQHIIDYCFGLKSLYYLEDEKQNVLTVKF